MTRTHTTHRHADRRADPGGRGRALVGVYYPGHWTRPDRATFGERVRRRRIRGGRAPAVGVPRGRSAPRSTLPIALHGDGFQRRVWERLAEIPYGETITYGEIARELGDPTLARAVGGAVGHNPLSVIVPCHRVVGKDGKLTGYAGGLERKRFLLDLESPCAQGELVATAPSPATSASVAWRGTTSTGHGAWSTR